MVTISTTEPAAVTAGDTLTWQKSLPDYPASQSWVLSYVLINTSGKITINASASGDDHIISVSSATSAGYSVGDYDWAAIVSKAGERHTVGRGRITINPDITSAAMLDGRSTARKALEALESAYLDYITNKQGHVAEYEIAGRRMKFRNAVEIWQQIDRLRREVAREDSAARIASGLSGRRRVLVRFGGN